MSLNYFSFLSYRTGERCYRRKIIVSAKQLKKSECSCYLTALPPTLQTDTLVIYLQSDTAFSRSQHSICNSHGYHTVKSQTVWVIHEKLGIPSIHSFWKLPCKHP